MKLTDFNNISKNVLKFHSNDLKTTPPEAEFTIRVEFSKPKLKISITITKASKLRSFGASYIVTYGGSF